MKTEEQIKTIAKLLELRDAMKSLYGKRWPIVAAPYIEMIAAAMIQSGNRNPLSVVIPIAKEMSDNGDSPGVLLAVAIEMESI